MDLSFALRRNVAPASTPDLQALLSAAAARQESTPAARAYWRRCPAKTMAVDPRVALFASSACDLHVVPAHFAVIEESHVNSRQQS